ncbi:RHS repeat-associated core domain-containing protein [Xanthomonas bonasiae]|uniref:RHS repeat-associated core domain-containing protein n=1 Tax=Xanthomonas bonasiae TaxID=2810351 RepID=UPI0019810635|nr:RHS repeat-associated core domain-containing protein [Xanthomonas bonasiae]MBN6112941.1 RHS repeat-associated core domain-containing protein [Xanthomonas bonasiae]
MTKLNAIKLKCYIVFVTVVFLIVLPCAKAQTVRYIHTDSLGSVVLVTDSNRNVVERREYEPYGSDLTGAKDGPSYAGHVTDAATELTYMEQRYYDSKIGIFLSADPVTAYDDQVDGFNGYRYANGNPYRFVDPDGRQAGDKTLDTIQVRPGEPSITTLQTVNVSGLGTAGPSAPRDLGSRSASARSGSPGNSSRERSTGRGGWFFSGPQANWETELVAAYGLGIRYTRDWKTKKDALGVVVVGVGARGGLAKSATGLPAWDLVKTGYKWGAKDAPVDIVGSFSIGPASGSINFDPGTGIDFNASLSPSLGAYTGVSIMFDDTLVP